MFKNKPEMAKLWSKETPDKKLPEKKRKGLAEDLGKR